MMTNSELESRINDMSISVQDRLVTVRILWRRGRLQIRKLEKELIEAKHHMKSNEKMKNLSDKHLKLYVNSQRISTHRRFQAARELWLRNIQQIQATINKEIDETDINTVAEGLELDLESKQCELDIELETDIAYNLAHKVLNSKKSREEEFLIHFTQMCNLCETERQPEIIKELKEAWDEDKEHRWISKIGSIINKL